MASERKSLMLFLFFKVHNRIIRVILMLLRNSCITIVMAFLIIIISLDMQLMIRLVMNIFFKERLRISIHVSKRGPMTGTSEPSFRLLLTRS
jgi:hypothetical protein